MKLKNDINLLKAAGNKQKIQSKAPLQIILIVIVVGVLGVMGYMFFSQSQKINDLQTKISKSKSVINNSRYAEIVEKNNATSDLTDEINSTIEYADKLSGYYDTVPAMFPELSEKHVYHLRTYVAKASNSAIEEITYTNATAVIKINSPQANMETEVIEKLLACSLFRKVGYQCPVCGKATYYTATPSGVYCNYDHDDLPDVEVKPNEDGSYSTNYVCALKNIVDICVTAPILTSDQISVIRPAYSTTALTIEASSENTEALKNYYKALFDSGYFLADTVGYLPTEPDENGVCSIKIVCNIPQPKATSSKSSKK